MIQINTYRSLFKYLDKAKVMMAILLILYLVYVFYRTVFGRSAVDEYCYNFELFWSYRNVIETGSKTMAEQIVMNYLMLMPIVFLLPLVLEGHFKEKSIALITILTGFAITCSIEFLQLILKRGLFEFDDIIGNTMGTIIGYLRFKMIRTIINKMFSVKKLR